MDEMQTPALDAGDLGAHPEETAREAEWREMREWRKSVELRFRIGDRQFGRLRQEMKANTAMTSEIHAIVVRGKLLTRAVRSVIEFFVRVGKVLISILRKVALVATWVAAIWALASALIHHDGPPKIH